MTRFNFLASASQLVLRSAIDICAATRTRNVLLLPIIVVVIALIVVHFERNRQSVAISRARAETTDLSGLERNLRIARADSLATGRFRAKARFLEDIRRSGTARANELVEVANLLPEDLWVTSIDDDGTRILLHGEAQSYATVARLLRSLAVGHYVHSPTLLSAETSGRGFPVAFRVNLSVRER